MQKNYFVIFLPYFLFAQGVFVFYKIIPMLLTYYRPEALFLFPWLSAAIGGIMAVTVGIGILLRRRWSAVLYLILSVFPILVTFLLSQVVGIMARVKLPGVGESWVIVLNIIFALCLLFIVWKKWGKV